MRYALCVRHPTDVLILEAVGDRAARMVLSAAAKSLTDGPLRDLAGPPGGVRRLADRLGLGATTAISLFSWFNSLRAAVGIGRGALVRRGADGVLR